MLFALGIVALPLTPVAEAIAFALDFKGRPPRELDLCD